MANLELLDERIRSRAEHWRISRMAVVDRNILRLAVYEFLYEPTPRTVAINEALEIARRFSTYEATQFINGISTPSNAISTNNNRKRTFNRKQRTRIQSNATSRMSTDPQIEQILIAIEELRASRR